MFKALMSLTISYTKDFYFYNEKVNISNREILK